MVAVRKGEITVASATCMAGLSKEITASMQVEVNVAKVRAQLLDSGRGIEPLVRMGALLVGEGADSTSGETTHNRREP
jgi:hypothetical protein